MISDIKSLLSFYLAEDFNFQDDITTLNIVEKFYKKKVIFNILCKESSDDIVVCGLDLISNLFDIFGAKIDILQNLGDGGTCHDRMIVFEAKAFNTDVLKLERTMLNIIQHLSGVATKVSRLNDIILTSQAPNIKLLDTRKTSPGMRYLQKYAVKIGGGQNHRFGLFDRVLIKENHISAAGGMLNVILALKQNPLENCEIECQTEQDIDFVLANADLFTRLMLDNFTPSEVQRLAYKVKQNSGLEVEVSGGINDFNLSDYCLPCVDFISMGSVTHSVKSIDFSLDIIN